jgi:hypothetical protein
VLGRHPGKGGGKGRGGEACSLNATGILLHTLLGAAQRHDAAQGQGQGTVAPAPAGAHAGGSEDMRV